MPAREIKTLILRFRDLSTSPGDTIARHRATAKTSGSVWWGWWHKDGETIPDDAFRAIANAASVDAGVDILLFDSDRRQIFEANCVRVSWDNVHHPIYPREQPELVPEYYQGRPCLAWFRFVSISEPRPKSILQKHSYVDVPEFFTSGESGYRLFDGKRISSVEELRQQNRTIWFIRDVGNDDPTHEIKLFDSHQIEPSDFLREHIVSSSTDLLWVSDLHFSEDHLHAFALETSPTGGRSAWDSIKLKLNDLGIQTVAGVIASGDFAWKAAPLEFDQARKSFFDKALDWSKELKNYHFLVCPGNHDLCFSSSPADKTQPVSVASAEARAAYENFYQNLYFKRPNAYLSCGRRFLLGGVIPVEIASLNSCLLDQKKDLFQGQGFVGEDQMRDAARQLGWESHRTGPRAVRIVVIHHHLLPVSYSEAPFLGWQYSLTLDAEALMRWLLENDVDLVLHGHQHQPFYTQVVRPIDLEGKEMSLREITVVGLGSTGVDLGHLGETKNNMFALVRFGLQEARFQFFSINPKTPSKELFEFRVDLSKRSRLA